MRFFCLVMSLVSHPTCLVSRPGMVAVFSILMHTCMPSVFSSSNFRLILMTMVLNA